MIVLASFAVLAPIAVYLLSGSVVAGAWTFVATFASLALIVWLVEFYETRPHVPSPEEIEIERLLKECEVAKDSGDYESFDRLLAELRAHLPESENR